METRAELDAAQHAGAEPPTLGSLELGSKAHSANLSAGSLKTLREMVESRNKELEMRVRMNSDFNKPVQVWRKESNPPKIPPTIDESAAAAPAGLRIDEVETPVKAETPTDQGDEEWREYRYSIASQNESTAGPGLPGAPAAGADQDHHYEASTHSVGELEERKQPRYEYERRRSSM
jgi:hypothetical protein